VIAPQLTALAVAVALAAGVGAGWKVRSWRCAAADAQRLATDAESQRLQVQAATGAAARHEVEKARIAQQRRVITREVDRVITVETAAAAAVCLGPDGLRIVAAAAAGQLRDTAQPADGLPGPEPAR
jgi:multidrug efflux pump subunit AcrA (membrane-fusion protein)